MQVIWKDKFANRIHDVCRPILLRNLVVFLFVTIAPQLKAADLWNEPLNLQVTVLLEMQLTMVASESAGKLVKCKDN